MEREGGRKDGGSGGQGGWHQEPSRHAAHRPRDSLCQPSTATLILPSLPTAHQCLSCDSGTSLSPSSAATGELRAFHHLVPHAAGWRARRQPLPLAPEAANNNLSLPLCVRTMHSREPHQPERGSLRTMTSLPPFPSLQGHVGTEEILVQRSLSGSGTQAGPSSNLHVVLASFAHTCPAPRAATCPSSAAPVSMPPAVALANTCFANSHLAAPTTAQPGTWGPSRLPFPVLLNPRPSSTTANVALLTDNSQVSVISGPITSGTGSRHASPRSSAGCKSKAWCQQVWFPLRLLSLAGRRHLFSAFCVKATLCPFLYLEGH